MPERLLQTGPHSLGADRPKYLSGPKRGRITAPRSRPTLSMDALRCSSSASKTRDVISTTKRHHPIKLELASQARRRVRTIEKEFNSRHGATPLRQPVVDEAYHWWCQMMEVPHCHRGQASEAQQDAPCWRAGILAAIAALGFAVFLIIAMLETSLGGARGVDAALHAF
jgi:hypothetical protein